MARVCIHNVKVMNNPCEFSKPFQFEITFDCLQDLQEDTEWKIIYVCCADQPDKDETLDSVLADPPDPSKIKADDAIGVTVVLITCSYLDQEFLRIGYYLNNEYDDPVMAEDPPSAPDYSHIKRTILDTDPRVTRFQIKWDDSPEEVPPVVEVDETDGDDILKEDAAQEEDDEESDSDENMEEQDESTLQGTTSKSHSDDAEQPAELPDDDDAPGEPMMSSKKPLVMQQQQENDENMPPSSTSMV